MIRAIDVSYAQPNVDYAKVRAAGVQAVIVRNGYLGKTDTEFDKHVKNALSAGLKVGTYTYLMSENAANARKEAAETVKRLETYKGKITFPVFADMEDNKYMTSRFDKAKRTEILLAFLDVIEKAGYFAAVYINPAWLESYVDKTKIIGRYDVWLAAWTYSPDKPTKYGYSQTMWQWGIDNTAGVNNGVDGDLVYIDYPAKIRAAGKNFLNAGDKITPVTLAFDAAIRADAKNASQKLGVLTAGSKCAIVKGSDTLDAVSKYTYVRLAGGKEQWIVKSAIKT